MASNKLKAFDIIKEALTIFARNTNCIILTSLISLPLFCFSLYFEASLQDFLLQTSAFLLQAKDDKTPEFHQSVDENSDFIVEYHYLQSYGTGWSLPLDTIRKLNDDLFHKLLKLSFLYLVPFHLLEFLTVLVIVDLASKIYREDKTLTFNNIFDTKTDGARLWGILVTYGYVVFFSTCTLLGFLVLLITYWDILRYFPYEYSDLLYYMHFRSLELDVFFHLVYGANFLLLLGIYLGWSAVWNLGLVVSVLKGTYGAKALGSSAYLSLRSVKNGMILMLVFSIWGVGLRFPCMVYGCYKSGFGLLLRLVCSALEMRLNGSPLWCILKTASSGFLGRKLMRKKVKTN